MGYEITSTMFQTEPVQRRPLSKQHVNTHTRIQKLDIFKPNRAITDLFLKHTVARVTFVSLAQDKQLVYSFGVWVKKVYITVHVCNFAFEETCNYGTQKYPCINRQYTVKGKKVLVLKVNNFTYKTTLLSNVWLFHEIKNTQNKLVKNKNVILKLSLK